MNKIKQSGFTVLEGLLVGLMLLMLFGVGYYVFNQGRSSEKTTSTTQNSSSENVKPKKYFEIKEFGIRFEQPESLQGIKYEVNDEFDNSVFISHDSYLKSKKCAKLVREVGFQAVAFVAISEHYGSDELDPFMQSEGVKTYSDMARKNPEFAKQIGNRYYVYTHGNGIPCDSEKVMLDDYEDMFQTIEAIP